MYYVCKMCGRGMRSDHEKPNFCYYDRSPFIENISDEDAKKMGLLEIGNEEVEFERDHHFDPFTGAEVESGIGDSLSDHQEWIMGCLLEGRS